MKTKTFHLNYAAVGQLSTRAADVLGSIAAALASPEFYDGVYPMLENRLRDAKRAIAHLLGDVNPRCLAFATSTSDAFASLIQALPLSPDAAIAVGRSSFISLRASINAVRNRGIEVHEVGDERGCVRPEDLDRLPNHRISLVVVEWVNWLSGYRNDIHALATQCRETNIPLIVDGVQGLGAADIDFDLARIGALICGGHKWLCGPEGTGFCYVAEWLFNKLLPTGLGYRSLENAVDDLTGALVPRKDASVLEVGTQNTIGLLALAAAIRPLRNNAYSHRIAQIRKAVTSIIEIVKPIAGVTFLTPLDPTTNAGIVTFKIEGNPAKSLQQHFAKHRLICGVRDGWVRMSPGAEAHTEIFRRQFKAAVQAIHSPQI